MGNKKKVGRTKAKAPKSEVRDPKLEKLTAALAGKKSHAERILAAIDELGIKRVHDAEGATYLIDGRDVLLVDGMEATNRIHLIASERCGLVPTPTTVRTVVNMLRAQAADERAPAVQIHQRWAHIDDKVFYDLGDPKRRAVEITKQGWRIITAPPAILFRRPAGYKTQSEPCPGGDISELKPLVNLDEDDWILFKGLLLSAAQAHSLPCPITVINGEQDSGKTTISRIMSEMIDPRTVAGRGAPKNRGDLLAAMSSAFLLVFDNVSYLDGEMCDALCLCATGVASPKPREHFTRRPAKPASARCDRSC